MRVDPENSGHSRHQPLLIPVGFPFWFRDITMRDVYNILPGALHRCLANVFLPRF